MEETGSIDRGDGVRLAWATRGATGHADAPTVVFLPGFGSDMSGAKAVALDEWCAGHGHALLRLDYSGHGASGGAFTDGTIGRWYLDARHVIEAKTRGRLLLVGSSMGGWIGLLLARALGERVAGFVGIAAAPDFTERLMWESMAPAERAVLRRDGVLHVPSQYGPPTPVTLALIEDGRNHLVLDGEIPLAAPVRLLHGQRDPDVPWEFAPRIAERVTSEDVRITLIKDGDHRLSRPADLALLTDTVAALLGATLPGATLGGKNGA
jgi:pimeloyl-ACP methyl ester carboxylesterase